MESSCVDIAESIVGESNFHTLGKYEYLFRKESYPIEEISLELLYTDKNDRAYIESYRKDGIFKVYDCGYCYMENSIAKRGEDPVYYEYLINPKCNFNGQFEFFSLIPNSFYDHSVLLSTIAHQPIEAVFTNFNIMHSVFEILSSDQSRTIVNNGGLSNDNFHCHMYLLPDSLDHLRINKEIRNITQTVYYSEFMIGQQRYFRLSIRGIGDVSKLTPITDKIYKYLSNEGMLATHNWTSTFYVQNKGCNIVFALTRSDNLKYGYLPNIPTFRDDNLSDKKDISFIDDYVRDIQYNGSFWNLMKDALKSQYTSAGEFSQVVQALNESEYPEAEYKVILDVYNQIYAKKEDTLINRFDERHKSINFGKYKIFLTLLEPYINNDEDGIIPQNLKDRIFKDEFSYSQKVLGDRMNYSLLSGLPPVLTIEEGSEKHQEVGLIEMVKRIGEESVNGQIMLSAITNKYMNSKGSAVLKMMLDMEELDVEYKIGKELNPLRYYIPHFMYTFDKFKCRRDITLTTKNNKNVLSIDFSKSTKACFEESVACTDESRNTTCSQKVGYIFLELIKVEDSIEGINNKLNTEDIMDVGNYISVYLQVALALQIAQDEVGFNHNDLHLGNVVVIKNPHWSVKRPYIISNYTLKDGREFSVPVFRHIPIIIDYGNGRTDKTEDIVKRIGATDNQKIFREAYKFSDSNDMLTLIKASIRRLSKKRPSKVLSLFERLDIKDNKRTTYEKTTIHVLKDYQGYMDNIINTLNEMLESIIPSPRNESLLFYDWGYVTEPGYFGV